MTEASTRPTSPMGGFKPAAGIAAAVTVIGGTLVIGGHPVSAATIVVDTDGDVTAADGLTTLREAVETAVDGDTIAFDPSVTDIVLTQGSLRVGEDLVIGDPDGRVTISADTDTRVVYLYGAASVTLTNLTITGVGTGAISDSMLATDVASLTLDDVSVRGGANGLRFESPVGDLTVTDSEFSDNNASGVSVLRAGDVVITDSIVTGNDDGVSIRTSYFSAAAAESLVVAGSDVSANAGTNLYVGGLGGDMTLVDSHFDAAVGIDGRGMRVRFVRGSVQLANSSISGNTVPGEIVSVEDALDLTGVRVIGNLNRGFSLLGFGSGSVSDSTFAGNALGLSLVPFYDVDISDSVFSGNTGDGLQLSGSVDTVASLTGVTIDDNGGDGLYLSYAGAVTLTDSTVSNSAEEGVELYSYYENIDLTIENSTISGSGRAAVTSASYYGTLSVGVVNSTISGNATDGTAVFVLNDSDVVIGHSTITGNGDGSYFDASDTFEMSDSTVSVDHSVLTDNGPVPVGSPMTVTNSLTPVGSSLGPSNTETDDPLLGPLADNGGPTETMRPQSGSPAVDAGDPAIVAAPATDQRGEPREAGTIDIGSVEVNGGSVSVADVTVDEAAGSALVTVTRSDGAEGAASVQASTASGTALTGADFTEVNQTLSWAEGELGAKTVTVPIIDDVEVEGQEFFAVALSNASGVAVSDGAATVTITDDDITGDDDDVDDDVVAGTAFATLDPSRFVDTRAAGSTFDDLFEAEGKRTAGSEYRVQIAGRGGVPTGATGVVVNVTAVAPEATGFVTVHPCVTPLPLASSLNYTNGVNLANEIVAPLSGTGELCIYTSEAAHIVVDVVGFIDATSPTTPVTPARYLDTRASGRTFDGADQAGGRTNAGDQVTLEVTGRGDVPSDAVAVIANVTAVNPDGGGFVTVHPCEPTPPNASSLNYVDGVNRANELVASVNSDGEICLFTSTATDLLVDIVGYIPAGTTFNAIGPARFLDTRSLGETVDGVGQGDGKRTGGSQYELQVAGRPGVPASATSVVVNVTAVAPEATGFVTVHPCEGVLPNASSLNYVEGVNGANELITRLDADGKICLYSDQDTHLIVDVVGYLD